MNQKPKSVIKSVIGKPLLVTPVKKKVEQPGELFNKYKQKQNVRNKSIAK